MWNLPEKDRWRLYRRWVCDARKSCDEAIADFQDMFDDKVDELKEVRRQEEYEILKNAAVIGMTTTGNIYSAAARIPISRTSRETKIGSRNRKLEISGVKLQ